jgi:hypothetical protein
VRDPGRQHHSTPFPRYSSDLLPEEYDSRYDACHERNGREDHFRVQLKNPDEGKQKHDCDDEERSQNSNRTQSQDEESYTPRSPSATSPPERGFGARDSPYIRSSSNKPNNNNVSDTKPRHLAFEAGTGRWTGGRGLSCTSSIRRLSSTRLSSSSGNDLTRISDCIHPRRSTLPVI